MNNSKKLQKIKLVIEYDGTSYAGWQIQKNAKSVQEVLQNAFLKIIGKKKIIHGSGRTDSGVHARGQTAHTTISGRMSLSSLFTSLNAVLPEDIAIREISFVHDEFHARFDVRKKKYRYTVIRQKKLPVFERNYIVSVPEHMSVSYMKKASKLLTGTHDFSAFSANDNVGTRDPVKRIDRIDIFEKGPKIIFDIEGNGFLYKMVRTIVGTLLEVGKGKCSLREIQEILKNKDIKNAGPTLPARGLCLWEVYY